MAYRRISLNLIFILTFISVAAQGFWDKEKYPDAEPVKEELLREFTWAPGESNRPIGIARGIYPGRVVFTRYPEVCQWGGRWYEETDQWFLPENTSPDKCREMVSATVQKLTGTSSDSAAWEKIFSYHNTRTSRPAKGYRKGEKVALKVNLNNAKARESHSNMSDCTPQLILAMVGQLVNAAGVSPSDIIIYDARRPIAPEILRMVWDEFPDVTFLQDDPGIRDYQPVNPKTGDYSNLLKPEWVQAIDFSYGDFKGARLLPRQIYDATYIVNLAMLKLHSYPYNYMELGDEGQTAVTMTAKNHAGSVRAPWEMHHFLNTQQDGKPHAYSPLVDLNASPNLGAKTILYMLDGLYCGRKHASYPLHFPNAPFYNPVDNYENREWPACILASLDEVALESVGLDLLYAQSLYNNEGGFHNAPRIMVRNNADDYLKEMADPQNAPSGIKYIQGGKPVESLGVFEHWDSPSTMRYSRNLDSINGKGIELVYLPMGSAPAQLKEREWFYWQNPINQRNDGTYTFMTTDSLPGRKDANLFGEDIIFNNLPDAGISARFANPSIFKHKGRYIMAYSAGDGTGEIKIAAADDIHGAWNTVSTVLCEIPLKYAKFFRGADFNIWICGVGQLNGDNNPRLYISPLHFDLNGLPSKVYLTDTPRRIALPDSINLVPDTPSTAPDYMCTWNLQGYLTSYKGSVGMRAVMTEKSLFGNGPYEGWLSLYPRIREDLIFVMDDSWDIPADVNSKSDNPYLGLTELDESRFPSFSGTPAERLKALTDTVKAMGWKGLGGWICAQKSDLHPEIDETTYWTDRIKAANEAGFTYWKVDWGRQSRNEDWRRMLSSIGKEYAPQLVIEHAMKPHYIEFSDTYRTYDVENITAQPVTIQRICQLLPFKAKDAAGIINCEDEPYIAAGLGCAIGVMRHPFVGNVPDGDTDHSFPSTVRDLKRRINEVERAVRWHRIAPPFGVDGDFRIDSLILEDNWEYRENESWVKHEIGSLVKESAPARVSRRMELPIVSDTTGCRPYVLSSAYPNGAVAVATIGRTLGRSYISKEVPVNISVDNIFAPIGVFGYYKELIIDYPEENTRKPVRILAQDLIADKAVDITDYVLFEPRRLIIPGNILRQVGLMGATPGDLSDPGLVLQALSHI